MKRFSILPILLILSLNLWSQDEGSSDFRFTSPVEEVRELNKKAREIGENSPAVKIQLSQDAFELADREGLREARAEALATVGIGFFQLQELEKSLESLNESYEESLKYGFTEVLYYSSFHLALLHHYMDDSEKALFYFEKCLEVLDNEVSVDFVEVLKKIAGIRIELSEIDEADSLIEDALELAEELEEKKLTLELLFLSGEIRFNSGEIRDAVRQFLSVLKGSGDKVEYEEIKSSSMSYLGRSYANLGDYSKALSYGQDALLLSVRTDNPQGRMEAYKTLSLIYEYMGNFEEAYTNLNRYYEQRNILEKEKSSSNLNSIKAYYEAFEKEKEIGKQQIQIESQNRLIIAGSLMLLFLAGLLVIFFFLYKKNSRIADKLSRDLKRELVLSKTDPLTGLPNRKDLEEKLIHAVNFWKRDSSDFSLILISFESHKKIDRELGDGTGEKMQKFIGSILKSVLKGQDTVAVWKPFFFAVLLPDTNRKSLTAVQHALINRLSNSSFTQDQAEIPLSFRLGVTTYEGEGSKSDCIEKCKRQLRKANT